MIQQAAGSESSIDPVSKEIGSPGGVYSIAVDIYRGMDCHRDGGLDPGGQGKRHRIGHIDGDRLEQLRSGDALRHHLDRMADHTVYQAAKQPDLDPAEKEIGSDGGSYSVAVNIVTMWNVVESLEWVRGVTPMAGDGSGSVTVTVDENTLEEVRSGTISMGGFEHLITQEGAAGLEQVAAPVFSPNPAEGPFEGPIRT